MSLLNALLMRFSIDFENFINIFLVTEHEKITILIC
jgi:hypothetical protein